MASPKKRLSSLFRLIPEGRIKNIVRLCIYKKRKPTFYKIDYNLVRDIWSVETEGILLFFKKNPFHVFSTNPLFLKNFPNWQPDIIVDAGAFHGTVGLLLAKRYPSASVYLLEPDSESFETLSENIRLNKISNAFAIKKGLWNSDGKLFFRRGNELSSAVVREGTSDAISIEAICPTTLLNNARGKKIFFKMNVEGAELEAVPACESMWKQNRMVISVASDHYINNEFTFKSIEEFCKNLGIPCQTEHFGIYKTTYIGEKPGNEI